MIVVAPFFRQNTLFLKNNRSLVQIFVWDFALLNKYYQIIKKKKKAHVSQFHINYLRHLNVCLVSAQGSLALELRNLSLDYME